VCVLCLLYRLLTIHLLSLSFCFRHWCFWRRLLACLCVCSCGLECARVLPSRLGSYIDFTPSLVCVETRTTRRGLLVFAEATHRVCVCVCVCVSRHVRCGWSFIIKWGLPSPRPCFSFFFFLSSWGAPRPPNPPSEQARPKESAHDRFPLSVGSFRFLNKAFASLTALPLSRRV